ncbi:unnamed protein product [Paramecium sonneborni]|uniref:Uncharacterized protein n=1 Tax=Paramecium sonneborni TaxID=65129 RepID=A0A8S1R548_9CILI|nr:unnamed protein product [Paramecium sonneborni]
MQLENEREIEFILKNLIFETDINKFMKVLDDKQITLEKLKELSFWYCQEYQTLSIIYRRQVYPENSNSQQSIQMPPINYVNSLISPIDDCLQHLLEIIQEQQNLIDRGHIHIQQSEEQENIINFIKNGSFKLETCIQKSEELILKVQTMQLNQLNKNMIITNQTNVQNSLKSQHSLMKSFEQYFEYQFREYNKLNQKVKQLQVKQNFELENIANSLDSFIKDQLSRTQFIQNSQVRTLNSINQ